jgi:Zn-dependent protease
MEILIPIISFLSLIIAITIHEFSHALVADKLGDPTPRSMGRLSLNPMAHADMVGTILLPLISAFTGIPTIGWAKPVIIDPFNFRHPKRDEILVSIAGPLSNLLLALILSLVSNLFHVQSIFIYLLVLINISLFVFNLIPVPPLDGSKIILNLLPSESSIKWQEAFDHYGFILIIILVFLPVINGQSIISAVMSPLVKIIFRLFLPGY